MIAIKKICLFNFILVYSITLFAHRIPRLTLAIVVDQLSYAKLMELKPYLKGGLHDILEQLKQMGLTLVVASNPIYPRIAMEKRLVWGDVDIPYFELVTHMENMNFVKPDKAYYKQIYSKIGVLPEYCLMVGNDPGNDMAAAGVKMKTYLATDGGTADYDSLSPTNDQYRQNPMNLKPDFSGPLAGIIEAVRQLYP